MTVSNEFKVITKKIKQQDSKVTLKETNNKLETKQIRYSFEGQLFKTIMKQIVLTTKNINLLKGKNLNFQYGLFVNNEFEYIDLGDFYIKDVPESNKGSEEAEITAYDKMVHFMKTFKQSEMNMSYPCTMSDFVNRMCEICGVTLYSTDFFNNDLMVLEDYFTAQGITYRDVLVKVAQATLSTIYIKENKLFLSPISSTTEETLDRSYLSKLVITDKFGPVNALILGRGDVEDNIEAKDQASIDTNGRCEMRFDENEFIDSQREQVINKMFEKIKGLTYYAFEGADVGIMWLEPTTSIALKDNETDIYNSYYLEVNVTINTGIKSSIEAKIPEVTNTEYKVTTEEEKKTLKVERMAKKNEGLIQDLIEETSEHQKKISEIELTSDSIKQKVEDNSTKINNNYQEILQKLDGYATEDDVISVNNKVEAIQSSTDFAINVIEDIQTNGVSKVTTTTGYKFDENGLEVSKTGSETKSILNEKGLDIKDNTGSSEESLLFAGYDEDIGETIVKSKNMTVQKYLVIGKYSRVEDYHEGTGVFWIGGD